MIFFNRLQKPAYLHHLSKIKCHRSGGRFLYPPAFINYVFPFSFQSRPIRPSGTWKKIEKLNTTCRYLSIFAIQANTANSSSLLCHTPLRSACHSNGQALCAAVSCTHSSLRFERAHNTAPTAILHFEKFFPLREKFYLHSERRRALARCVQS